VREGQRCVIPLPTNGSDTPGLFLFLRSSFLVSHVAKSRVVAD